MIKKIALASTLLVGTIVNAEIQQKGFFVGIDASMKSSTVDYDNNAASGGAFVINDYTSDSDETALSYKFGYQYYFTRLYARVASYKHEDSARDKYTITGTTYEINTDYIPLFYVNDAKTWDIRGVFGIGIGYNSSAISDYDVNLLPTGVEGDRDDFLQYGMQIGIMAETEIGLSVELGARFRQGHYLEYTDGQNYATFSQKSTEYYLGVNYLF